MNLKPLYTKQWLKTRKIMRQKTGEQAGEVLSFIILWMSLIYLNFTFQNTPKVLGIASVSVGIPDPKYHQNKLTLNGCLLTHTIHVWCIYLHLVDFYGKCRCIFHAWILWVMSLYRFYPQITHRSTSHNFERC